MKNFIMGVAVFTAALSFTDTPSNAGGEVLGKVYEYTYIVSKPTNPRILPWAVGGVVGVSLLCMAEIFFCKDHEKKRVTIVIPPFPEPPSQVPLSDSRTFYLMLLAMLLLYKPLIRFGTYFSSDRGNQPHQCGWL